MNRSSHAFLITSLFVLALNSNIYCFDNPDQAITKPTPDSASSWQPQFDQRIHIDQFMRSGECFSKMPDGRIVRYSAKRISFSDDHGQSWTQTRPVALSDHKPGAVKIAVTQEGIIVIAYMNSAENLWEWDSTQKEVSQESRLPVYAISTRDEGQSWSQPICIFQGRSGALTDIISTTQNTIVLPITGYRRQPSRLVQFVMVTNDGGASWTERILDIGGHGHHDGAMEPTMVELNDGRIWMLIRTNHDCLYECYSQDGGMNWTTPAATSIDASSSPAMIRRLQSGRLILVWNRVRPHGQSEAEWVNTPLARRAGDFSISPSSWHREEVSLAFSTDDGKTWSKPQIIAKQKNGWLSYPKIFEPAPGEIKLSLGYNMEIMDGPKAVPRGAIFLGFEEKQFP